MSKSSIADILEVQRLISRLDRRGKQAILKDLMKQNLEPKKQEASEESIEKYIRGTGARTPVTYTEGGTEQ